MLFCTHHVMWVVPVAGGLHQCQQCWSVVTKKDIYPRFDDLSAEFQKRWDEHEAKAAAASAARPPAVKAAAPAAAKPAAPATTAAAKPVPPPAATKPVTPPAAKPAAPAPPPPAAPASHA